MNRGEHVTGQDEGLCHGLNTGIASTTKGEHVSWFEAVPETSLRMLDAAGITSGAASSTLAAATRIVDALLDRGLRCITVLDVSGAALERLRQRLGSPLRFRCGSKLMSQETGQRRPPTSGTTERSSIS